MTERVSPFAEVPVPVVGLTGGIASGKSSVAEIFAELGIPGVDADQVARTVVGPGSQGLAELIAEFGDQFKTAEGSLDRQKLGQLVFRDATAKRRLEGILHPLIRKESILLLKGLADAKPPYLIYEAALIVEINSVSDFAALVVVATSKALQIDRLIKRSQLTQAEAEARVASQAPLADKLAVADYVIRNDGTLEATRGQVADVDRRIRLRLGSSTRPEPRS